jgi:hypothetical protein
MLMLYRFVTKQRTMWSCALLERQLTVLPLSSFPAIYWTQKFITTFTRALHFYLSWARPIQSTPPQSISTRSILMLSTHILLVFLVVSFPSVFLPITFTQSSSAPFVLHNHVRWDPLSQQHGASLGCGWRLAVSILNKQLQTDGKGWSSSFGIGRGANNTSP